MTRQAEATAQGTSCVRSAWKTVAISVLLAICVNAGAQTLPGEYDPDNLLARTARGEIPAVKLYEDEDVLAFLGDRPSAVGHFLVISKTSKAKNFLELSPEELARILAVAQRVARAEIAALGAEGFTLRQNNGSASSIMQFHLHVVPRWKGDQLEQGPGDPVDISILEEQGEKIRAALQ